MIKKIIKKIIKSIIKADEKETVSDRLQKIKYNFFKKINKNEFDNNDIRLKLDKLGLKNGDSVIIHASYRAFIGYKGTPEDFINLIFDIIGKDGTIIMPAFTNSHEEFSYNNSTTAGYIAETFRNMKGTERSLNVDFSMCSNGNNSNYYINEHVYSKYHFDEKSPYFKAINNNFKILLIGLDKKPHKITLFHCVTYQLRNKMKIYKDVYNLKKEVKITNKEGKTFKINVIDRNKGIKNSKIKFKKLFKKLIKKSEYERLNFLDIYLFNSKEMYRNAQEYIYTNNYNLYKKVRM